MTDTCFVAHASLCAKLAANDIPEGFIDGLAGGFAASHIDGLMVDVAAWLDLAAMGWES